MKMDEMDLRARAIALYDRFTHQTNDRRAFMADMVKLAGSAAAANTLVASIAASPAAAAIVAEDDARLTASEVTFETAPGRSMKGYLALPKAARGKKLAAVIVIHENRGLQPYTRDVARRLSVAGFAALAPDFLSPVGGTPANEDAAREAIGKLDLAAAVADGVAAARWLESRANSNGKVGVVGFCWGGAMVNRLAVAGGPAFDAGVAFYGLAPAPAEAGQIQAPLMLHYAGTDDRVNATAGPWVDALRAAGKSVIRHDYPGTQHAFHNDSSAARYDPAAAKLAWDRTIAFFEEKLK
jgi:carboxymethylenebutenolidase